MQTDTLVLFSRFGMGHAEPDLQQQLAGTWLKVCLENGHLPGAIAFYTEGVRLACEGSPVLDELAQLAERGVHLILCKTCLDSFGLTDSVRVGVVGGMGDIFAAQATAEKVIHL